VVEDHARDDVEDDGGDDVGDDAGDDAGGDSRAGDSGAGGDSRPGLELLELGERGSCILLDHLELIV
jgi:hypothetical protein